MMSRCWRSIAPRSPRSAVESSSSSARRHAPLRRAGNARGSRRARARLVLEAFHGRQDMKFADRYAAGRQLAATLVHLKDRAPVVLALPRGGVAVGFEIA